MWQIKGLAVSMIGPALIDLSDGIRTPLEEINIIYPVGAVGYFIGGLLGKSKYIGITIKTSLRFMGF